MDPNLPVAHYRLAQSLMAADQDDQALEHFQQALVLRPVFPEAAKPLGELAMTRSGELAKAGHVEQAMILLNAVRKLIPHDTALTNALARYFATCPDRRLRRGDLAVRLARQATAATGRNDPELLDTLAAAYAEQGDFEKAAQTAVEAAQVADKLGRRQLMMEISNRAELYRQGQPYRETPK
jgi:tetratricopeptide (TPR) repeat protein